MDDDGDGLIDSRDPDCLGPCDNNEDGYHPGIPSLGGQQCALDCYYDQDQGSGNDTCEWDHRCDPKSPSSLGKCDYQEDPPPSASCPEPQTDSCHDFCDPLTPNGCDCFGCCTFPEISDRTEENGGKFVYVGSRDGDDNPTCTLDDVTDTEKCHPCTPVEDCYNDC
jgi:hypothetical protein